MRIKYDIYNIENSQGSGTSRQYVQIQRPSAMTEEELCEEVHDRCTATAADVKAVLSAIREIAQRELSRGSRFYIPEIGYLSLSVGLKPRAAAAAGGTSADGEDGDGSTNENGEAVGASGDGSASEGNTADGTGDDSSSSGDDTADGGSNGEAVGESTLPTSTGSRKITGNDVCVRGLNFKPEARFLRRVRQSVAFERADLGSHAPRYTDAALWARVSRLTAENGYIDRPTMQHAFGLSEYMARKWLAAFADSGRLVRRGSLTHPLYTLPRTQANG